jgi:TonB-linked SusC/RagA family outer membrane protein
MWAVGTGIMLSALTLATPLQAQDTATAQAADTLKTQPVRELKSVEGCIYDAATGAPMEGVRVKSMGDDRYTAMTDEKGHYTIRVPKYVTTLWVEVPDYNGVQLAVKGEKNQDARLYSGNLKATYTTQNRITASNKATIDNSTSISVDREIENLLNGDVRTVSRTATPGQGAYMLIRGINSLNANSQPLVVVDGVIMDMQTDRTTIHEGFYNNILAGIDVEDIESVEVLKNATALYGAKGANGVLLITTKRGKSMATKINVSIFGGFESTPYTTKVLDGNQFRTYASAIAGTTDYGKLHNTSSGIPTFFNDNPSSYWYPMYHNNTNWSDGLSSTAWNQNYKVNVQGGDDVAMYNLSLGYAMSDATAKGTDMDRLNIRFNTDINLIKNLKTGLDIYYSRTTYNIKDNGWAEDYTNSTISSPNVLGLIQNPALSKYGYYTGEDGKLHESGVYAGKYVGEVTSSTADNDTRNPFMWGEKYIANSSLVNPYWVLENGDGTNKNHEELTMFFLNVNPEYEFNRHLHLNNRFSYSLTRQNEKYFLPVAGTPTTVLEGLGDVNSQVKTLFGKETSVYEELRLDWKNRYDAHSINVFGGFRMTSFTYTDNYANGYNLGSDKMPNMSYSAQYKSWGGDDESWMNIGYFANADYNYAERYYVQATATMESSSRFGKDGSQGIGLCGVRWGLFPSLQAAWVISAEPFFKTNKNVNYLKLTAGYDMSGNDNIDASASRTYFQSKTFLRKATGLVLANIENPDLQWETTHKFNVGLEGSFLDNRLHASIDVFYHKTNNLLTLKSISYLTGLQNYWCNEGSMSNKGVELNLNGILINTKDFQWELGATLSHYKNKITSLPEGDYTTSIYGGEVLTAVGKSAGVFYGYQTAGVFSTEEEAQAAGLGTYLKYPTGLTNTPYRNFRAGDVHFVDQNGDGIIDESDKVVIGNPNPDIYGNIFTSFHYKRWTLSANFKYSVGNDVYNYQRSQLEAGNNFYNQSKALLNRWTHEGQVTSVPRVCSTESDEWVNNERFSDRWIEDGSYLKLKTLRLTYALPLNLSWLQGVTVYGEGSNLFTLSKYLGKDPETSCGNNVLYQGIDTGMLRYGRAFTVGVKLNL